MRSQTHSLPSPSVGTRRELVSLHFGPPDSGSKVYVQAGLHADELPGVLVAHHLRGLLGAAEDQGLLAGAVVLVPLANPIGLSQTLLHLQLGRFEQASGHNFNRLYPNLVEPVARRVDQQLGADAEANKRLIRAAMREELLGLACATELEALRRELMLLAHDADLVLDLHCDFDAVMHLYTETPYWPQVEPLARYLGAQASLLNRQGGGHSFDEACGSPWWQLAERYAGRFPVPLACADVTVELRGQRDVGHALAAQDAQALMNHLRHIGVVSGAAPEPPPLLHPATPLAGTEVLRAPCAGVLAFNRAPGDRVQAGELVCEIVDPMQGKVTPVHASVSGVLYARSAQRYATLGMDLADIAGAVPLRTGWLLSA
jgi:predicted deacylase